MFLVHNCIKRVFYPLFGSNGLPWYTKTITKKGLFIMKFKFKGINYYEDSENNYVGAVNTCSIVKEFADFQAAIDYVADHKGFLIAEDGKTAFNVLIITEID
ncbi:hypothetical protein LLCC_0664 [Lactococcus cremoris]|uniref:Uncharacterized protein n=2 Tax=Lactococcus lactis subsp. cremoris TaxID=1359 RepID=A0AAD1K3I1_LACLC|nr:hypothetical protein LLCC_0664 [Lactococcus cremoris]BCO03732.1 hypothetical protein LLG32_18260 [Lactococcus cremoris]BCO06584.1 hypothetical protein LLC_18240 [Lactococcus cremoris]